MHLCHCLFCFLCQIHSFRTSAYLSKFSAIFYKHGCNKDRFCNWSFGRSRCLKRFSRFTGKTVQIQTVIPVRSSDQRKFMRSQMCHSKPERPVQMLKQRFLGSFFAVEWNCLFQDSIIPCFFEICCHCCNKPQWIIIESTSYVRISLFCQRLILMIGTSVHKLC